MVESGRYDAVICLGVVIRGATPHFDFIAGEAAKGIAQVGLQSGVPVTFGVITSDTVEQAIERAGSKAGNKGVEAALAAIEPAGTTRTFRRHGANCRPRRYSEHAYLCFARHTITLVVGVPSTYRCLGYRRYL